MEIKNFTFLTNEQCGSRRFKKLKILKKRGTKAAITDFAILSGGRVGIYSYVDYVKHSNRKPKDRIGIYWTSSTDWYKADFVTWLGDVGPSFFNERDISSRPAATLSSLWDIRKKDVKRKKAKDGVLEIEYGYYPQYAPNVEIQKELEENYKKGNLETTGNSFTLDFNRNAIDAIGFSPEKVYEYNYKGKQYVRMLANLSKKYRLPNGKKYKDKEPVWVEVQPVKWWVDKKSKIILSEKILFANIPFNTEQIRSIDFNETDIKKYLDQYFAKELIQPRPILTKEQINANNNSYNNTKKNTPSKENQESLTILTADQVNEFSEKTQLEVLKKYGMAAAATDLCILRGGIIQRYDHLGKTNYIKDDQSPKGITCEYWTKTDLDEGDYAKTVTEAPYSTTLFTSNYRRYVGIRPVLQSPEVFDYVSSKRTKGYNETEEVEYGEYPQYAVDKELQEVLENEYHKGMKKTGKSYTFDAMNCRNNNDKFRPTTYEEYEYQGKKYIRVVPNIFFYGYEDSIDLSNGDVYHPTSLLKGLRNLDLSKGESFHNNKYCKSYAWVEVEPVTWLIDDKTKLLISKKVLLSGIRFNDKNAGYDGDFSKTELKEYLDNYMLHDLTQKEQIKPTQSIKQESQQAKESTKQKVKNIENLNNNTSKKVKVKTKF